MEVGATEASTLAFDRVDVGAGGALAELAGLVLHGELARHHLHLIHVLDARGLGLVLPSFRGGTGEPQEGEEDEEGEGAR